jgi:hypothetical protein
VARAERAAFAEGLAASPAVLARIEEAEAYQGVDRIAGTEQIQEERLAAEKAWLSTGARMMPRSREQPNA